MLKQFDKMNLRTIYLAYEIVHCHANPQLVSQPLDRYIGRLFYALRCFDRINIEGRTAP